MYGPLPSFVLGFHGCDRAVAEDVFAGNATLKQSENDYDWLGHGIYFWESNPARALEYAQMLASGQRAKKKSVQDPAVVGAVIDLGLCLNLLDAASISIVKDAYTRLKETTDVAGGQMPENLPPAGSNELLLRKLDCAVIRWVHKLRENANEPAFESVRGVFVEGPPLYPNAGFHERSHVQICVRNHRCIKGYFRVIPETEITE